MDSVNGRRYNQQGRIANGVSSGQLTAGETKNLESREAGLNKEIHNDRAANGGTLTPQERGQVNQQQNNLSKSIYNDKHNANTATYGNNEVGARRNLQQQRIANGVASGQMSPSEAAKAENHEQNINKHIARRSPGQRRKTHAAGKKEHQRASEQRQPADLQREAQRKDRAQVNARLILVSRQTRGGPSNEWAAAHFLWRRLHRLRKN